MSTPLLQLETLYILDDAGRIVSTNEPYPSPGAAFCLIRSASRCTWAVGAHLSEAIAAPIGRLAQQEPPAKDFRMPPVHQERYIQMIGGRVWHGPAFTFPDGLRPPEGVVRIEDERLLASHFPGGREGEIQAGRAPVMAVVENGVPVSLCCSSRWSRVAAEAGVETAEPFRGRGLGERVTAAWAVEVRAMGRTLLYSTSWSNTASLALARKLNLQPYAVDWSISVP